MIIDSPFTPLRESVYCAQGQSGERDAQAKPKALRSISSAAQRRWLPRVRGHRL